MEILAYYKFEKIKLRDLIILILYLFGSLLIFYLADKKSLSEANVLIAEYSLITQLILYAFLYRSLRNLSVYFLWLLVAIMHFLMSFTFKGNLNDAMPGVQAANGLRDTIILLLLFQVLRFGSLYFQKRELIPPFKNRLRKVPEERTVTFIDFIAFFLYITVAIYLMQVSS
ncbi:hypothetical protein AAE02nite_31470 [Adhaeribacter aerolatus]|uniref:Uncharacterized protein n=1 Tax=Adhaeribacter aerolatus TaxID=670289 RepID=A0A512B0J6_9BACT|nr:hypothetical protein [Adhaeribacter aerolatus]GEO05483.1 hypothetical protein AAE02nite_31470 [Adhaeribacter aerolatus]